MQEKQYLDTNILMRAIRRDIPEQAEAVEQLFRSSLQNNITLVIDPIVIFETVYNMESKGQGFMVEREDIRRIILALISESFIEVVDKDVVVDAIRMYVDLNIPIGDAFIAARMIQNKIETIHTFDKHFSRVPEITPLTPQ